MPAHENSTSHYDVDFVWEDAAQPIYVEIKVTSSVRDVRDAFFRLAHALRYARKVAIAVCVVVDSKLSQSRLHKELSEFLEIVHSDFFGRIHFLACRTEGFLDQAKSYEGSFENGSPQFYTQLSMVIALAKNKRPASVLPARQIVVAVLAQMRLWNLEPVTISALQNTCKVSYPTVAHVLTNLTERGWLEDSHGGHGVRLRSLTESEWIELARDHARLRKVHLFADPTNFSSPVRLAQRLWKLQQSKRLSLDIRVGGVVGAAHHFPDLDITAAPRLDLSVSEIDPQIIASMLDAGLRPKTTQDRSVALAIHVTRDPWMIKDFARDDEAARAGELECLADLLEMGYEREAREMASHMTQLTLKT